MEIATVEMTDGHVDPAAQVAVDGAGAVLGWVAATAGYDGRVG